MSRFYTITLLSAPSTSTAPLPTGTIPPGPAPQVIGSTVAIAAPKPIKTWTSFPNGANDPGALNVQFDFSSGTYDLPTGASTVTIEGVALSELLQAYQYAGKFITVAGGMQAGLPLANPKQSGIIMQGKILQSFGNWVGTDMSLDFVVYPAIYTVGTPGNFVLNWPAGTPLATALARCLQTAYLSKPPPKITIGAQYVLSYPVLNVYQTLPQLAKYVASITSAINAPAAGVTIAGPLPDGTIIVTDNSAPSSPKTIVFTDLIGQPTWIDINRISFATVMRADIQIGNIIRLPPGLQSIPGLVQTQAAASPSQLRYQTTFQGAFIVQSIRQIGNFRDPNGAAWSTIFEAAPIPGSGTQFGPAALGQEVL